METIDNRIECSEWEEL